MTIQVQHPSNQKVDHSAPQTLVILAAGMGSRIRAGGAETPKPLVDVGGLPLLKRAILTATRAQVERFVVILGYEAQVIQEALEHDEQLTALNIQWVFHEQFQLKNGVSVLQAKPFVDGEFYLTMADHVVEPAIYTALANQKMKGDLALAVDYKLDQVFDMDDATKVKVGSDTEILEIDKALSDFDAVDTGVFRCSPKLFEALETVYEQEGDVSLSQGVKALADQGKAHTVDVGKAWWQDVDDLSTRDEAERRLFASLTKDSDGFVSKNFNRPVSKWISRRLMRTSVSPNHVTATALFIGLLAAIANCCADADSLWLIALGGILFHLSSVVDGVDGELARLRFQFSEFGAWFDTISDVIINHSYLFTLGIAATRITGEVIWAYLSTLVLVLSIIVLKTITQTLNDRGETYLPAMDWSFKNEADCHTLFQKICKYFAFAARRDFYAFSLMFMSFMGVIALKISTIASVIVIGFVFGQHLRTKLLKKAQLQQLQVTPKLSVNHTISKPSTRPESTTGQIPALS